MLQLAIENSKPKIFTKAATTRTVRALKVDGSDFEFYPTSKEHVDIILKDIERLRNTHQFATDSLKILEVGAGDCRVSLWLKQGLEQISSKYDAGIFAIEKAPIHTKNYSKMGITLLGTEFHETNLISKSADIAFCSPPFSEMSLWSSRLIAELNYNLLYLIVPVRWKNDIRIKDAIERRQVYVSELAEFDFVEAHRQARGKVNLLRIGINDFEHEELLQREIGRRGILKTYKQIIGVNTKKKQESPFQYFVEHELGLKRGVSALTNGFYANIEKSRISEELKQDKTGLVKHIGVVKALVQGYERDILSLSETYKHIGSIQRELLDELGCDYDNIVTVLKSKFDGLRAVYWDALFEHLDVLRDRLITANRVAFLDTLNKNSLDFTVLNALYIIDQAVTLSNQMVEDSLVSVFKSLTDRKHVPLSYKSNLHTFNDDWRYNSERCRYILDYRFVVSGKTNFQDGKGTICRSAQESLRDICTVLSSLGYSSPSYSSPLMDVEAGQLVTVSSVDPNGNSIVLLKTRFYLNGNRHYQFEPNAMLRLNIAASRILGWVRSKQEFCDETGLGEQANKDDWYCVDKMKFIESSLPLLRDITNE